MSRPRWGLSLVLWALSACGSNTDVVRRSRGTNEPLPRSSSVAVAPTQLADDGTEPPLERFLRGTVVGHIRQTRGYVFDEVLRATRSSSVAVSEQRSYAELAAKEVEAAIDEAVSDRGWVREVTAPLPAPRWHIEPGPTEPEDRAANFPVTPVRVVFETWDVPKAKARLLLAPVVVHAYSHNANWFLGRKEGSPGGARVRVVVGVFDTELERWTRIWDLDASAMDEDTFQPDRFEARTLYESAWQNWRAAFRGMASP